MHDMKTFSLDPRTKVILWIFANISLFVFMKTHFSLMMMIFYAVLFILSKKYDMLIKVTGGYAVMYVLINFIMPLLPDFISFLLAMIVFLFLIYPSVAGAVYMISTTSAGEVADSFRKMHIPDSISVMFTVILRFFPAVKQEFSNIRSAMKLRRIKGIMKKTECIYVPLLVSIAETAEELGESITARGIENPAEKTSWHRTGFHIQDIVVFAISVIMLAISIYEKVNL